MKNRLKKPVFVVAALGGGVLLLIGGYILYHLPTFTERDTRPFCHKQIHMSLIIWTDDHKTDMYPNVNGSSQDSLLAIVEEMVTTNYVGIYNYVPGLKEDDSPDLVLLYSKWPTRFIWHGDQPTLLREKRWVAVPPDFHMRDFRKHRGELSDWVATAELKARLQKTLEFLKTERRTNWQQVVKEHTAFLESLPK